MPERLRAADRDREAVTELLREQHLSGRLDHDELEYRVGRCLAATTYLELDAIIADLPRGGHDESRRPQGIIAGLRPGDTMRSVNVVRPLRGLAAMLAVLMLVIWTLTSVGSYFWPAWVWLGLAIPFGFAAAIRWAWRRAPGPRRKIVVLWTVGGALEATLVVIWLLAGVGNFWPAWPLVALVAIGSAYSSIVLRPHLDPASRRSALKARVDTVSRSRQQVVDVQAAELGRIERDIHDGAQARLVALSMQLGRAELALEDQPGARRLVEDARHEASRAIADLRDLSRGISPPLLSDRGLVAAVRALAARYDADIEVDSALERQRLTPALERGAYFVAAEALTNAAKHAGAQRIAVVLALSPNELSLTVADDGSGGADPAGSGLSGLRTRVEALGGTLVLASAEGQGTRLEATLPTGS